MVWLYMFTFSKKNSQYELFKSSKWPIYICVEIVNINSRSHQSKLTTKTLHMTGEQKILVNHFYRRLLWKIICCGVKL